MKYLIRAMIVMAAVSAPAGAKVFAGCEVIKAANGNHFYKVDGACQFDRTGRGDQGDGKPA